MDWVNGMGYIHIWTFAKELPFKNTEKVTDTTTVKDDVLEYVLTQINKPLIHIYWNY